MTISRSNVRSPQRNIRRALLRIFQQSPHRPRHPLRRAHRHRPLHPRHLPRPPAHPLPPARPRARIPLRPVLREPDPEPVRRYALPLCHVRVPAVRALGQRDHQHRHERVQPALHNPGLAHAVDELRAHARFERPESECEREPERAGDGEPVAPGARRADSDEGGRGDAVVADDGCGDEAADEHFADRVDAAEGRGRAYGRRGLAADRLLAGVGFAVYALAPLHFPLLTSRSRASLCAGDICLVV